MNIKKTSTTHLALALWLASAVFTHAHAQVCQLPPSPLTAKPVVAGKPNLIKVDYHALVLSWSPQYCNSLKSGQNQNEDVRFQCDLNAQHFGFVVHGLWPQSNKGKQAQNQPTACKAVPEALDPQLIRQYQCVVPGAQLMQHEWSKHGVCAWDSPEEYFAQIVDLYDQFPAPTQQELNSPTTVALIKQAFVEKSKGALKPEQLAVAVASNNRLKEVYICLDLQMKPRACGFQLTPDQQKIHIDTPNKASKTLALTTHEDTALMVSRQLKRTPTMECPKPQTRFATYSRAKSVFWSGLYPQGGSTVYCQAPFSIEPRQTQGGLAINIEHATPQSRLPSASAKGDLHNLWPAIQNINSMRSNYRLVEDIPGEEWAFRQSPQSELAQCDFEIQTVRLPNQQTTTVVEPSPAARGPLARSILFMHLAYGLKQLTAAELGTYVAWHKQYPPTAEEKRRNDVIETLQGTRNPLIDRPEQWDTLSSACHVQ